MTRIAFTLRLPSDERAALENLSKIEGRPINQLLNEAVKSYLSRRGRKERSLEENLTRLRTYRERDPGFRNAIAAFVECDASFDDPLEGAPIEGQLVDGEFRAAGPAQSKIRELLGA
jgi:predicted transcriptional regulator